MRARRGLTLIELLVVISIMLIVTVIAVPAMKPAMENRKIREAAREVNVYLGSARNHAIELGRPVGVLFTIDTTIQGNPSLELQQVEIPATYAGDTTGATASVYFSPSSTNPSTTYNSDGTVTYTVTITFTPALGVAFHVGDFIQFDYQGLLFSIASVSSTTPPISSATATIHLPPGWPLPWPTPTQGVTVAVPFQITRLPVFSTTAIATLATQSAVAPLQLPSGTVIDLQFSGTNSGFGFAHGAASPMLIFSPAGGVSWVYPLYTGGVPTLSPLIDPVYFLIGRRDRMYLPVDNLANWQDPNNLWVSVTPQTGRITTVENAAGATSPTAARSFALQGQSKGGR